MMLSPRTFFLTLSVLALGACAVTEEVYVREPEPPQTVYRPPVVQSIYMEPPFGQPEPVRVAWAPPPMLIEVPPPVPYEEAVWVGGFWIWQGNWVWMHGHWASPPRPGYRYFHPYYEHRNGSVIFVNGFWAAADVHFSVPGANINIAFSAPLAGVHEGPRPMGPEGVFVPPPPGSRYGVIVPAPLGTPPAVVSSAPPVINSGMRITNNVNSNNVNSNNTTIVNNTTVINNYTIVAPANATSNGQAYSGSAPAQAHLAAAMHPVVHMVAPQPPMPPQPHPAPPIQNGQGTSQPSHNPGNTPPAMVNAPEEGQPHGNAPQNRASSGDSGKVHTLEPEVKTEAQAHPQDRAPSSAKPMGDKVPSKPTENDQAARKQEAEKIDPHRNQGDAERQAKKQEGEKGDPQRRPEEAARGGKKTEAELLEERKKAEEGDHAR